MKTQTTKLALFIAAIALIFTLHSCKKSSTTADSDLSTVQDNSEADYESNYIGSAVNTGVSQDSTSVMRVSQDALWGQILPKGVIVTLNTSGPVDTLTINFGTTGLVCQDGKTRKGEII